MLLTSLSFLVVQIPAFLVDDQKTLSLTTSDEFARESQAELLFVGVGAVSCVIFFFVYMYLQYAGAHADGDGETDESQPQPEVSSKDLLLKKSTADHAPGHEILTNLAGGHLPPRRMSNTGEHIWNVAQREGVGFAAYLDTFRKENDAELEAQREGTAAAHQGLLNKVEMRSNLQQVLRACFKKYSVPVKTLQNDRGRLLYQGEFRLLLQEMKLGYSNEEIDYHFQKADANDDKGINFREFMSSFVNLAANPPSQELSQRELKEATVDDDSEDENDSDDEEDEFKHLPEQERRRRIMMKSWWMMGMGTFIVLVFSDPMVDVLAGLGKKTGISAFYISFILAPLASNASELVAAFKYAKKKTPESITTSLSTLEGAAVMNNTFCLGIFFALLYFRGIPWKFTAETVAVLCVEYVMFVFAFTVRVQKLVHSLFVLAIYPASLALVWMLENLLKLD